MAKSSVKVYRLADQIYERKLFLIIGKDKDLLSWTRENKKEEWVPGYSAGRYNYDGDKNEHYLTVSTSLPRNLIYSSLAHEVFHFVFSALGDIGIKFSADSEEAFAYYLSMILDQALKFI